jgi:hypothetical protein
MGRRVGIMIQALQKIFDSVVKPEKLHQVIEDVIKNAPQPPSATLEYKVLRPFVEYQNGKFRLLQVGFQLGGPWVGEIGKEKILFLSSNPGLTCNHCNPRYMYKKGLIEFQGQTITNPELMEYLEKPLDNALNNVPNKSLQLMNIKNENSVKPLLSIQINGNKDGQPTLKGIRFWNDLVYKFLATLYLDNNQDFNPKKYWFDDKLRNTRNNKSCHKQNIQKKTQYLRYLVEKAVFTEIIPFGSQGEAGVNDDSLQFCWEKYSHDILYYSAAQIWVIVGGAARRQFSKIIQSPQNCPIGITHSYNFNQNGWRPLQGQPGGLDVDNCYLGNFGPNNQQRLILTVRHTNARLNAQGTGGYFKDSINKLLKHQELRREIKKFL